MTIERDADDVVRCFLLERMLFSDRDGDRVFEGEVVGLIGAGAFVAFGAQGAFQGLLPVRRLRGDWWELNEQSTMLIGTRSGSAIRLGDPVAVRVGTDRRPARAGGPAARRRFRGGLRSHGTRAVNARHPPGTSRPIAGPPTATTCSSASNAGSC